MHPEARSGLDRLLTAAGIDRGGSWHVLDLGGRDINGGIRDLLPAAQWTGVDISPGPGVDLVHDCTQPWPSGFPTFDLVVCTEVLEHVEDWAALLATCAGALRLGGPEMLFVTCASSGRRPHGASGGLWPEVGEWYRNVDPGPLADVLGAVFKESLVEYNPSPGDAYAYATGVQR